MNALIAPLFVACIAQQPSDDRAGFVTVLGRDTVALESFTRSASRLEGDIVVRVPGTVHIHYVLDLAGDGTVTRSFLEQKPLGMPELARRRVTLDFLGDSVRVSVDSSGVRRTEMRAARKGSPPLFTTGFGSSFGLYASLGMYELILDRLPVSATDTTSMVTVSAATGRTTPRLFMRRSSTQVDVDYFKIAWTHVILDDRGRIASVDAIETTEKTRTTRTDFIDIAKKAREYAARDRSGKGLGVASPDTVLRTKLGAASIAIDYGSPRKRGREILGVVVPYDRVWRTGANAATFFAADRALTIGGKTVPAGTYTLWTLPSRSGVLLIINRQHGQWGTSYDPAQDLMRIPMKVTSVASPQENFSIQIVGQTNAGELRITWDTFQWSVPICEACR